MAIVSLRLPTGWIADEASIETLRSLVNLRRHELNENKVNLYFDEVSYCLIKNVQIDFWLYIMKNLFRLKLTHDPKEFKINVLKKFEIKNSKPGLLSVYDYYEPIDESTTQMFEIENKCDQI